MFENLSSSDIGIIISIAAYMLIIIGIGIYTASKSNSVEEFYLGGRKLGPFVTAMSAEASDMSGWLLMGLPGVAYLAGLAEASWTAIGLALGTYLNWLIVSKRLRRYSVVAGNAITVPDFFSNRFRDNSNIIKFVSAAIIIIFFVPYTASGFATCGKLFATLFDLDYHMAMIICALVIIIYTTLGGFLAASTSDFIQSIVMTIALGIVVIYGIWALVNNDSSVFGQVKDLPGYLSLTSSYDAETHLSNPYSLITIFSTLAWGLGYFGMPHILLRFMAIDDPKKLTLSRRVATIWVVISMGVAVLIGILGYSMHSIHLIDGKLYTTSGNAERIIIKITYLLSNNNGFFPILAGIILAGILASTMSTSDSQLLAASSSVTENILKDTFKIKLSDFSSMVIARVAVIAISVIAIFFAWDPNSSVFYIVSFAWAGFGATFGPVMLFSLFWKRTNKYGVIAGMISGGLMVFIWKYAISLLGGIFAIYELLPSFIIASIVIVIVSLLTPAPEKEIVDEFELVKKTYRD